MDYQLIALLFLFAILVVSGIKYKTTRNLLGEHQKKEASLIVSKAKRRIQFPGLILVALLISCVFFFDTYNQIHYFLFFLFCLVLNICFFIHLKKHLLDSKLPDEFIRVVLRINIFHMFGVVLVVVAFAVTMM